jgi:hypothetical protein
MNFVSTEMGAVQDVPHEKYIATEFPLTSKTAPKYV